MKLLELNTTIKRNPELVSTQIDDERVMMNVKTGEYFGLDAIGNRIWELIENPIKINVLIETLLDEFDVTKDQCTNDTMEFLNQLNEKNLIIQISE